MDHPPLMMLGASSLPSGAAQRRAAFGVGQPYTANSNAWQTAREPGLDLGPQVVQEGGALAGLGWGGGEGQEEDGEDQCADGWTVGRT